MSPLMDTNLMRGSSRAKTAGAKKWVPAGTAGTRPGTSFPRAFDGRRIAAYVKSARELLPFLPCNERCEGLGLQE